MCVLRCCSIITAHTAWDLSRRPNKKREKLWKRWKRLKKDGKKTSQFSQFSVVDCGEKLSEVQSFKPEKRRKRRKRRKFQVSRLFPSFFRLFHLFPHQFFSANAHSAHNEQPTFIRLTQLTTDAGTLTHYWTHERHTICLRQTCSTCYVAHIDTRFACLLCRKTWCNSGW